MRSKKQTGTQSVSDETTSSSTQNPSLTHGTIDMDELYRMLSLLRSVGVTRFKSKDIEVELGPMMPPRSLEDFATTGLEEIANEDDGRFDHVGIRLRKLEPME